MGAGLPRSIGLAPMCARSEWAMTPSSSYVPTDKFACLVVSGISIKDLDFLDAAS